MTVKLNWLQLFQDEGIQYVSGGKNTSKGFISIKCPFCLDDPSEHLGVHLATGHWTCWRDSTHRSSSPERLLTVLTGHSKATVRLLIEAYTANGLDAFGTPVAVETAPQASKRPQLPHEFRPIEVDSLTHKFWQYLYDRGFDDPDKLISNYELKACLFGRWKGRVIIPVKDSKGLVGWQGRAIQKSDTAPKYLTSSELVKATIFNLQNLNRGDILFICEGPFDALKVDYYGQSNGMRATCFFGVNFTFDQINQLISLRHRFRRVISLLDNDSAGITASFLLSDYLPELEFGCLPDEIHDPGDLTKEQVLQMSTQ